MDDGGIGSSQFWRVSNYSKCFGDKVVVGANSSRHGDNVP